MVQSSIDAAACGPEPGPQALAPGTVRSLALVRVGIGCAAVLACSVVVGGWGPAIGTLGGVLAGPHTMKPNEAVGIALLGIALALPDKRRESRILARSCAALALLLGLAALARSHFAWNAGIDRPAPALAAMISLLGAALLCVCRPSLQPLKTSAALSVSLMAWGILNVHVFGAQALREAQLFGSVAAPTAVVMLILGVGTLAADPVSWPLRAALAEGAGGTICRWLLPPALLAPPFLGWALTLEGAFDVLPPQIDWALYSAAFSLGSVGIIMLLVHRITVIDAQRTAATRLSRHDALTGLANRRASDEFLSEHLNLARRHGSALSLMLLDIDRFKSYNDAYGHPAGDDLLKGIGMLLASLARDTDLAARVGGEEFMIVMPQTDLAGARTLAERIRTEVERSPLFKRRVTVSIGIVAVTADSAGMSSIIQDCDAALYRAKEAGRNRVVQG